MSSSSLYGSTGNVTVSANNLTTLYNATTGNVVTQNVPDRDFTTLYTKQTNINPTKQYGNSNVEAFLNSGTDGANIVQNIVMSGNLSVGGTSNLGPVGNVHITGGASGYVLATDGTGNLTWVGSSDSGSIPYIHFSSIANANNQQFSNIALSAFANAEMMSLFKNGVNIEPFYYEKTSNNTVQVNIPLTVDDTIDILPTNGGGGSGNPAGAAGEVQFNGGYSFAASNNFTFNTSTNTLTTNNFVATGNSNLGDATNVAIAGGTSGYVLSTDGSGSLSWVAQATGATVAGSNTEVQFNDSGSFGASANFVYNGTTDILTVGKIVANGSSLTSLNGANVTGVVANATYAVTANSASFSNISNISNVSYSVSGGNVIGAVGLATVATTAVTVTQNNQPNITSIGTLNSVTINGTANFTGASNIALGTVANLHILGGSVNQYLKTDGSGTLSWGTGSNISAAGITGSVQYNNAGDFAGEAAFTYDDTQNTLNVPNVNIVSATEHAVFATGVSGIYSYDTSVSSVVLCTTNTTTNFTINLLNIDMVTNDCKSFAFINKNASGSTYYVTDIAIGGVSQTVNWSGGGAPTTGSDTDIYNITVIQTSAAPTYSVFASVGIF